jgi:hypothetical protein
MTTSNAILRVEILYKLCLISLIIYLVVLLSKFSRDFHSFSENGRYQIAGDGGVILDTRTGKAKVIELD